MTTRKFSSTSIETTLLTSLASGATTATVATGTGGGLMGAPLVETALSELGSGVRSSLGGARFLLRGLGVG